MRIQSCRCVVLEWTWSWRSRARIALFSRRIRRSDGGRVEELIELRVCLSLRAKDEEEHIYRKQWWQEEEEEEKQQY